MHEERIRSSPSGAAGLQPQSEFAESEFENTLRVHGITVRGELSPEYFGILTPGALRFVASLDDQFAGRRETLLRERQQRREELQEGKNPAFLPDSSHVRNSSWKIPSSPEAHMSRRIEVSIPPSDRKMLIASLNSGADAVIADFDDAEPPTWENLIHGQLNLRDAARGPLYFAGSNLRDSITGSTTGELAMRPRPMTASDRHLLIRGIPVSGSLLDFGLYVYHAASSFLERGPAFSFYLPNIESHLDARLWNDVLDFAERQLGVKPGTFRATLIIDSLPAAFELDEILFELRDHAAGLYFDGPAYLFSRLQTLAVRRASEDTDQQTAAPGDQGNAACARAVLRTSRRRGIRSLAGPIGASPGQLTEIERAGREADELFRASFDGVVVLHPQLVAPARRAAGGKRVDMPIDESLDESAAGRELLRLPHDPPTSDAIRTTLRATIGALEGWLSGKSSVPLGPDIASGLPNPAFDRPYVAVATKTGPAQR